MNDYLGYILSSIFKILPLSEDRNTGLQDHIDSVAIQLIGSLDTYPELKSDKKYLSIINSINFLRNNKFTDKQCKREVLRCTNILQKMIRR